MRITDILEIDAEKYPLLAGIVNCQEHGPSVVERPDCESCSLRVELKSMLRHERASGAAFGAFTALADAGEALRRNGMSILEKVEAAPRRFQAPDGTN